MGYAITSGYKWVKHNGKYCEGILIKDDLRVVELLEKDYENRFKNLRLIPVVALSPLPGERYVPIEYAAGQSPLCPRGYRIYGPIKDVREFLMDLRPKFYFQFPEMLPK